MSKKLTPMEEFMKQTPEHWILYYHEKEWREDAYFELEVRIPDDRGAYRQYIAPSVDAVFKKALGNGGNDNG